MPTGRTHRLRPPGRRAFTMLELVLVIAIVALVSAVAVPRFGSAAARYRADLVARKVAADLEQARQTARLTGVAQGVSFDLIQHKYTVTGSASGTTAGYAVALGNDPYQAKLTAVSFGGAGQTSVTFDAYGQPTPAVDGTVSVRCGSTTRTVTVNGGSGVATWK